MDTQLLIGTLCVLGACTLLLAYCLLTMSKRAGSETGTADLATVLKFIKEKVMPPINDLAAAVARIQTDVQTVAASVSDVGATITTVGTDVQSVIALLQNSGSANDPAIVDAIAKLNASADALEGAGTSLTDAKTSLTATDTALQGALGNGGGNGG